MINENILNFKKLEPEDLVEVLNAVKDHYSYDTDIELEEDVMTGKFTKEDIFNAIANYRLKGQVPEGTKESYLPAALRGVEEDYGDLIR